MPSTPADRSPRPTRTAGSAAPGPAAPGSATPGNRWVVVQHAEGEGPGILADVLASAGQSVTDVHLHRGDALPHPGSFDAVVAMGGPMGANDEARYPWLGPERRWLADAVRDGRPVLGVCLGAQLLASALGARVWAGDAPELGLDEVVLSAEGRRDAVLGPEGERLAVVQWHGDTFDLPPGAVHLASSERYAAQAFRFGDLAYGLQFHLGGGRSAPRRLAAGRPARFRPGRGRSPTRGGRRAARVRTVRDRGVPLPPARRGSGRGQLPVTPPVA